MKRKVLHALILGLLISGCASNIGMTYYSLPSGATLFEGEGNRNLGALPRTYEYKLSKSNKELGYIIVSPLTAMWPSGASSSVSGLRLYLNKGKNQQFTFFRPKDVSGNELDVQNAIEQNRNRLRAQEAYQQNLIEMKKARAMDERNRVESQKARAMEEQNRIQRQKNNTLILQSPTRLRTNCTSRRVGNTVYTDCQ